MCTGWRSPRLSFGTWEFVLKNRILDIMSEKRIRRTFFALQISPGNSSSFLFLFFVCVSVDRAAGELAKTCSVFQTESSTSSPPQEKVSWFDEIRQSHRRVGREES